MPDANGNVGSITNTLDPAKNKTFTYDALDRLWTATGPWGSLGWTYDGVGNRLAQTAPEGSSTYTYQTGTNRLASVSGPNPITFGYDNNGNTTTENARTYAYNQNDRLIQATEGAVLGQYGFDASEQRATKTAGGQVGVFQHDQWGRILAESQPSGTTLAEYIYLNGQPVAKSDGATVSFIHTDQLGTPQSMTDASGGKVWEIESRPFGDGATITGSAALNLRFPGQYFDQETGLHQNWHREYAPGLGRYIEPAPLRFNPALNYYVYVGNNPVRLVDPLGLCPCPDPQCLATAAENHKNCLLDARNKAIVRTTNASIDLAACLKYGVDPRLKGICAATYALYMLWVTNEYDKQAYQCDTTYQSKVDSCYAQCPEKRK